MEMIVLDCGCVVKQWPYSENLKQEVERCKLHDAAPELYAAGKRVQALFDRLTIRPNGDHDNPAGDPAYIEAFGDFALMRAAIAKAEGR